MMVEVDRLVGASVPVRPSQGSYSHGSLSAGTHSGGGAIDISVRGLSTAQILAIVHAMRVVGFAAWWRRLPEWTSPQHIHGIAVGCSDLNPVAAQQVIALRKGENGLGHLGMGGRDRHANMHLPVVTWEHYLAHRAPAPAAAPAASAAPTAPAVSGVLTFEQVYALARSTGLSRSQAILATAIAKAESGLNSHNLGDKSLARYGSRGLWQIFTGAHSPSELSIGAGGWTPAYAARLEDIHVNAHAMYLISNKGTNWGPWSTYNNGSHKPFMAAATAAADRVDGVTTPKPAPAPAYTVTLGANCRPGRFDKTTIDLQRVLIVTGYAGGIFTKPGSNGYYGAGTQAAVRAFYTAHPEFSSGPKDAAIGAKGWAFLRSAVSK